MRFFSVQWLNTMTNYMYIGVCATRSKRPLACKGIPWRKLNGRIVWSLKGHLGHKQRSKINENAYSSVSFPLSLSFFCFYFSISTFVHETQQSETRSTPTNGQRRTPYAAWQYELRRQLQQEENTMNKWESNKVITVWRSPCLLFFPKEHSRIQHIESKHGVCSIHVRRMQLSFSVNILYDFVIPYLDMHETSKKSERANTSQS